MVHTVHTICDFVENFSYCWTDLGEILAIPHYKDDVGGYLLRWWLKRSQSGALLVPMSKMQPETA